MNSTPEHYVVVAFLFGVGAYAHLHQGADPAQHAVSSDFLGIYPINSQSDMFVVYRTKPGV
jgi:hypothetical protein